MKKGVHIYLESSPNPDSMKFVANEMLLDAGQSIDFPSPEAAKASPLASSLHEMKGVERVFVMSNFVTITKAADVEWLEIQNDLKGAIKDFVASEVDLFGEAKNPDAAVTSNQADLSPKSDMDEKIESILDEYVKPAVEMDGGRIRYRDFQEGVVTVELQGSCSGCPSATVTLKSGIENLLKRMVPEVVTVEAVEL